MYLNHDIVSHLCNLLHVTTFSLVNYCFKFCIYFLCFVCIGFNSAFLYIYVLFSLVVFDVFQFFFFFFCSVFSVFAMLGCFFVVLLFCFKVIFFLFCICFGIIFCFV